MYGWIWHHLPGGAWAKALQSAALIAVACAVLWYVVFPWLGPRLPFNHVTLG